MKTIRGTKDLKRARMAEPVRQGQVSVVYGASDPRQLRCPCGSLATNQPDGRGGVELRCSSCQRRFGLKTI